MTPKMRPFSRSVHGLLTMVLVVCAAASVPAEVRALNDTDVFFPTVQSTNQGIINPNILFAVDTSGSMACKAGASVSGNPCADTETTSRIDRLKAALLQILDELSTNVNVGLERYSSDQGGAMLFPVAPIDAFVEDVDLSGTSGDRVATFVTSEEASQTHSGSVTVSPTTLTVQDTLNPSSVQTLTTAQSRTAGEEAEQYGGAVNGGSARCADDLNLVADNVSRARGSGTCYATLFGAGSNFTPGTQVIGLRFTGLNLPSNATITNARLSMTVVSPITGSPTLNPSNNGTSNSTTITVEAENVVNSAAFAGGISPSGRPSDRSKTSSATWTIGNLGTGTTTSPSSLLTAMVQEVVDTHKAASAATVSALTFFLSPGSSTSYRRTICGFKYQTTVSSTSVVSNSNCSSASTVPQLVVEYTVPIASTANSKMVALRFGSLPIPQGVSLTSAQLVLRSNESATRPPMTIRISAENADESAALSTTTGTNGISNRTYTSQVVDWTTPTTTVLNDDYATPELKNVLNAVIGRSGWCGGNSLTLKLDYLNGTETGRRFISLASNANLSPQLNVSFSPTDPQLTTGCNRTVLPIQISALTDDSLEVAGTSNFPACTVLHMGATPSSATCGSSGKATITGLRFPGLNIPKNAEVISAFIELHGGRNSDTSTASLTFRAEAAGNPASYASTTSFLTGRVATPGLTSSSVPWSPPNSAVDTKLTTPDLKTIVQEIVNRSDWVPKNAISFIVTGSNTTGTRTVKSIDSGTASKAPKLIVTIKGPAGKQTVRQYLKELVPTLPASGSTPTMGVLYEAARYYRGEAAFYGRTRGEGDTFDSGESGSSSVRVNGRAVYNYDATKGGGTPVHNYPPGCSDFNLSSSACSAETWTGTTVYKSPIQDACQSNNIILLSDGEPNNATTGSGGPSSTNSITLIQNLIRANTSNSSFTCANPVAANGSTQSDWRCGADIADFLAKNDQSTGTFGVLGDQTVTTHTIAFGPDVNNPDSLGGQFLRGIANKGGGKFFSADSADSVAESFRSIISSILDKGSTFVAPAVTINTFNRLTHRNELYFALFKPSSGLRWGGNLKRYKLDQKVGDESPKIYGFDDKVAVDSDTGFFDKEARSFWTDIAADGDEVKLGGAAGELLTDIGLHTFIGTPSNSIVKSVKLDAGTPTATVSAASLGISTPGPNTSDTNPDPAVERIEVLKWASGLDVLDENADGSKTDARKLMMDPLHSEPVLVSYLADKDPSTGSTDDPLISIYFGTNDGIFRGINADSGATNFSFIPQELLPNLYKYYENDGLHTGRPYGMDGPVTSYVNDGDLDGNIITAPTNHTPDQYSVTVGGSPTLRNDFAYLYAGMRRGQAPAGSTRGAYYAFDVTNRLDPKIKFKITGGTGSYTELGQTWSRIRPVNIRVNGKTYPDDLDKGAASSSQTKKALLFTGGYDPQHDTSKTSLYNSGGTAIADSQGRALYLMDADTGALLWSADATGSDSATHLTIPEMKFAIPASPLAIDLDADGYVDRIYFADLGGQVFRIILGKDAAGNTTLSGTTSCSPTSKCRKTSYSVVARLSGFSPSASNAAVDSGKNARRFFSTPDVALIEGSGDPFLSISIGSGHREDPLSTSAEDRFYILRDPDVSNDSVKAGYFPISESDLVDVTTNIDAEDIADNFEGASPKKGLYIRLVNSDDKMKGEKALTESTTFNNQVIFATFEPSPPDIENKTACSASQGTARFYQINVADGTPVQNFNLDVGESADDKPDDVLDRKVLLNQAGLPPDPVLIFPSISVDKDTGAICSGPSCISENPLVFIGAESVPVNSPRKVRKTYWQKVEE